MERGVQRSRFDLQQFFRRALDVPADRVAVARPGGECSEDQQVERALKEIDAGRAFPVHSVDILHKHYVDCLQNVRGGDRPGHPSAWPDCDAQNHRGQGGRPTTHVVPVGGVVADVGIVVAVDKVALLAELEDAGAFAVFADAPDPVPPDEVVIEELPDPCEDVLLLGVEALE